MHPDKKVSATKPVRVNPDLPEFYFQSHFGQPNPTNYADFLRTKGSFVIRGVTRSQYEHLLRILTAYFTVPTVPTRLSYMCDPEAGEAFRYLLNHRLQIANACGRSESKTLHQFGAKVAAWDRAAMAPIEAILARTKA